MPIFVPTIQYNNEGQLQNVTINEYSKLKSILQTHNLRATNNQVKCLDLIMSHGTVSRRDLYQLLCPILHPNLTALLDRFEQSKLVKKYWIEAVPYYQYNQE